MTVSLLRRQSLARFAVLLLFVATGANACSREPTQAEDRLPPPSLYLTGTNRVVIAGDADTSLEVAAHVYNPTSVHLGVHTGADCPLAVSLIPDSTAEYMVNIGVEDCPSTAQTIDVAPGDSITLVRVLHASALSSYAQGVYGINVGIASSNALIGAWAGAVRLPLAPTP